jgi:hypothetical protein
MGSSTPAATHCDRFARKKGFAMREAFFVFFSAQRSG